MPTKRAESRVAGSTEPRVARDTVPMALGTVPPSFRPTVFVPPAQLGAYTLLAPLAQGGMSSVFLAEHRGTGERVAIKMLSQLWVGHPAAGRRLLAEYDLRRRAHHHGLVRVQGAHDREGSVPYLVMDLLDGENLGSLLGRGRLEVGAAVAIGAQIADAAAALHAVDIVHCDLKPDNVMVLYRDGLAGWPCVRVLDFGVARDATSGLTEIAGTPCYMAPEQWRGDAEPRTDVYGLGCTMYELLTGAPPFEGALREVKDGHCDVLPAAPSTRRALPVELDRLIMRMLSKDPRMRPRMGEVARVLTELAFEYPPGARADDAIAVAMRQATHVA